ncbi:hypothetical protein LX64_04772 [Chitinophaga skermanii]|uniref:Copper chaperone CopZ n=1 Tax=Chitinophaga skermanii TaxID=331697 RepID=A0A327Q1T9_9BACT|nr:hypothetical protein [Chitinophaga skermanii]RAI98410.1 hypothetical protein LX64_04772 [Chitinophaga skermanii]
MIGIFKTNINTQHEKSSVISAIRNHFEVSACNVDLEDCDKVLRIVDLKTSEENIIAFVQQQGYECAILE